MNRNEKLKALTKKAYECANISNDDYTTYPLSDNDYGVVQVSTIENGKTFNFISPANAKRRMEKQIADNLEKLIDNLEKIKCYIVEHPCGGLFELHVGSAGGPEVVYINGSGTTSKEEWYGYNGKYLTEDFSLTENLEEAAYIIVIDEDNI